MGQLESNSEGDLGFPGVTDEESIEREFDAIFDLDSSNTPVSFEGTTATEKLGDNVSGGDSGGMEDAWVTGAQFVEKKKEQYKREKKLNKPAQS